MQNFLSFLRALLIFGGTFLIGHNLFGHAVDSQVWEIITGTVISLASLIWGVASKQSTVEGTESLVRSIITAVGGLLTSWGVVTNQTVNAVLGFIAAMGPFLQSVLAKNKTVQIATGVATAQTNGKVTSVTQVVKTP